MDPSGGIIWTYSAKDIHNIYPQYVSLTYVHIAVAS